MSAFNPRPPDRLPSAYWLTRDRMYGVLSEEVEAWAGESPHRAVMDDGDVVWLPEALDDAYPRAKGAVSALLGTWTLSEAIEHAGVLVPATDIECVLVCAVHAPRMRDSVALEALA